MPENTFFFIDASAEKIRLFVPCKFAEDILILFIEVKILPIVWSSYCLSSTQVSSALALKKLVRLKCFILFCHIISHKEKKVFLLSTTGIDA